MKVLCLIDSLGSGGAQRQLVALGSGLKQYGHAVVFLYYSPENFYQDQLLSQNINVVYLKSTNLIERFFKIRAYIRKSRFDVVISFLGVPSLIAAISGLPYRKWKLITSERSANPQLLTSIKKRAITIGHLFSDVVISNSYANIELLKKGNPLLKNKNISVIYNSVDLDKFCPNDNFKFLANGKLNLVVTASYRNVKNLFGLIEAVNLLSQTEKEKLIINWYGDMSFAIKDGRLNNAKILIEKHKLKGVFNLNEQTSNIENIIKNADIVGLFSFHEGFPNTICEGMSCAKPIIVTSVSDMPLIIKDEINGKICNASDFESIANALRFFLYAKTEVFIEMGKKNRDIALQKFDQKKRIFDYLQFIE